MSEKQVLHHSFFSFVSAQSFPFPACAEKEKKKKGKWDVSDGSFFSLSKCEMTARIKRACTSLIAYGWYGRGPDTFVVFSRAWRAGQSGIEDAAGLGVRGQDQSRWRKNSSLLPATAHCHHTHTHTHTLRYSDEFVQSRPATSGHRRPKLIWNVLSHNVSMILESLIQNCGSSSLIWYRRLEWEMECVAQQQRGAKKKEIKNEKVRGGCFLFVVRHAMNDLLLCVGTREIGGKIARSASRPEFECLNHSRVKTARSCVRRNGTSFASPTTELRVVE